MEKLICIIGPDGVGKTTQIKKLIEYYNSMGEIYEYRWLRFKHFFSLPLLAYGRIMGYTIVKQLPDGSKIGEHHFYQSRILSLLYPYFLFVDMIFFLTIKLYIPLVLFKKKIICDRIVYDTIVDLMISLKNENLYCQSVGKLFYRLLPSTHTTILLLAGVKTIQTRRFDLQYDDLLNTKYEYYDLVARFYNITIIDSDQPIENVQNAIRKYLSKV
jgi:thymidylate kinase